MSHHKSHVGNERASGNVCAIYWRLLRMFAFKYWGRLFIGLFAALAMSGAFRFSLSALDMGMGTISSRNSQPVAAVETVVVDAENAIVSADEKSEMVVSHDVSVKSKEQKMIDRANEYLGKIELILAKCHIHCHFERVDLNQQLSLSLLMVLIVAVFVFIFLKIAFQLMNRYSLRWVAARVVTDLRRELYGKLLKQPMSYYSSTDVGRLMSRCTNDTAAVEGVIANSIPDLTTAPLMILAAVEFMVGKVNEAGLSGYSLLALLAVPICIVPIVLISKLLKKYQRTLLSRISIITSRMQEGFSGINVIRAFMTEESEILRFDAVNEKYFKCLKKAILADEFVHPLMQISAIVLGVVFVVLCFKMGISLGTLLVVGFALQQIFRPLKDLAQLNAALLKSSAAAERIFEIIDLENQLPEAENPEHIDEFSDSISFKNVSFKYGNSNELVLEDINLDIPKGHMVALVGHTGSGKTTLANLLARFYDPTSGAVYIDGHDVRNLAFADLRRLVGIVSQDTFLFNESIEYNIKYGRPEASQDELERVANQANIMEFVNGEPEGFARIVGERGSALSGGQRQRVAIARAIMRNPPILILDEATSALDTVTERMVQDALNNVMKDRTVLVIAHRLSTIQAADTILVMEQGKVIERGSHQELLALGGKYKQLYDIQFSEK